MRKPKWLFDGESEFWYGAGLIGAGLLLATTLVVIGLVLAEHC